MEYIGQQSIFRFNYDYSDLKVVSYNMTYKMVVFLSGVMSFLSVTGLARARWLQ